MFGLDHLREQFLHKEMELCKYGLGSNIYLCTNDKRNIPLNPVEQPMALSELENKAANLAKFLDVGLEGI